MILKPKYLLESFLDVSAMDIKALTAELKATESERWKRENKAGMEELNHITN
ncbi:type II toxin-antitoxin system CcdA family antitoxin [Photorhabdus viridis]|uniref:type II toxin-antitoxin system CcdA family antitoxin n=1 Tax=Photorhabdus viridis TaxID=3163327 RepID=UPI00330717F9